VSEDSLRDPTVPAETLGTGQSGSEPAPAPPTEKSSPAARRRAGNSSGGKHQRQAALIGLGQELPVVSLRSSSDRMAILEATLGAVAAGKTSGLVAQTIISLVRVANELARGDQEDAVQELERRVDELLADRVIPGRR
jgi:hypothetical protein